MSTPDRPVGQDADDPVWAQYLEAVTTLARLPALVADRERSTSAEEEAAMHRAQTALDAAHTLFADWTALARRTMTNAEARLVAAHVLVPDPSLAPTMSSDDPEALVESLVELDEHLSTDIAALEEARRRSRVEAMERAANRIRQAELRRQLYRIGLAIAAIIVFALLLDALT